MNLEESNSFMQEEARRNKKKKTVIAAIVLCSILIILSIALIILIQYEDAKQLKMYINGKQLTISPTLYKQVGNETYVNAKEIGKMLGYDYTQGEYNQYNEDEDSCYLTNDFEIVSLKAEENTFTKYAKNTGSEDMVDDIPVTIKSENGQAQKYSMENEIELIDGSIYVPFEELPNLFNAQLDLSQANRIRISSFEQIIVNSQKIIAQLKYPEMSGDYENLKAMIYGFAVVSQDTDYGVISLRTGKEIIGLKYEDITFIPNLQDFLIKAGNTVGIFASDGSTVIKPTEYDEISVYDEEHQLYLVKKDNKYGILNRLGETIIYPDYDQIGYKISANGNSESEYKIIFDKCIPVKEGTKYGLYSVDGEELLACAYDEFGSSYSFNGSEENSNEKPVLEIPPELGIKGIVINQNGVYGVYDTTVETIIIPIVCTRVYSVTKAAKTTYYVEYEGQQINLDEYLEMHNLKNITIEKTDESIDANEEDTNTVTTETSADTTTETSENDKPAQPSTENSGETTGEEETVAPAA